MWVDCSDLFNFCERRNCLTLHKNFLLRRRMKLNYSKLRNLIFLNKAWIQWALSPFFLIFRLWKIIHNKNEIWFTLHTKWAIFLAWKFLKQISGSDFDGTRISPPYNRSQSWQGSRSRRVLCVCICVVAVILISPAAAPARKLWLMISVYLPASANRAGERATQSTQTNTGISRVEDFSQNLDCSNIGAWFLAFFWLHFPSNHFSFALEKQGVLSAEISEYFVNISKGFG